MAEFALGLAKTAVEGTLSLVKSAVEEEEKLREKVQNDLVFITGEFEVMQSFLQDFNREHAASDKVALTLVRQIRTLAFDVEDCVEYVVHLDLDKSSCWGWLRRAWHTVYCLAPPLPLDVAVAEIKQLKARVDDVSQRNTRYNHILRGSDKNNKQEQPPPITVMLLPAEEPPYATTTTYDPSSAAFHILRDAWQATGKWRSNMCNLRQELLNPEGEDDPDLQVISVWGRTSTTGGGGADLGTSSVFRKTYLDPKICEKFKVRAWVKLTHPFNHDEFVKSLLAQFSVSSSCHHTNTGVDFSLTRMKSAEVIEADNLTKAKLMEQRFLVVLEDVFTLEEWDVIRMYLPNSKNGSRILLLTPQLGIALMCTGEPYQVSELKKFPGDNQFLCAFFQNKKRDIVKFYRQLLQRHGVISVWGAYHDKSNLVDILYKGIINGWLEEIEGAADKSDHVYMLYKGIRNRRKIEWHSSWVDVPDPFDLKVFAQRLFLNFHSDDIRPVGMKGKHSHDIREVGKKGKEGLIKWCREFLSEGKGYPYVVVINGLRSKDDWDRIQSTFFSSEATMPKGCILVITNEETMATYCVKDHTHLALNAKDLMADPSISALINKGCWHYAIRGKKGRLFYDRRRDAREWAKTFEDVGGNNPDPDEGDDKEGLRVFTVTGNDGAFEKGVLRHAYYGALFQEQIERRSWVDVPRDINRSFDLKAFSWRLLLDFYSDDPEDKETIAVDLMEGTIIDPIEKCRRILRKEKCLVVITGRLSTSDWNLIEATFFSEQNIQNIIIFEYTLKSPWDEHFFYHETNKRRRRLDTQEQGRLIYKEYCRIFPTEKRYQEAIQWVETGQLVGREREVDLLDKHFLFYNSPMLSVWGIPGVGKSTLVRNFYYGSLLSSLLLGRDGYKFSSPYEAFAWVDVPSPFNLTEFAWRLFLDLYSDDPQAKQTAAISMMEEGHQVLILECCNILRTEKCLVVMDGVHTKQDWDSIKSTFLSEPIYEDGGIVVITNEEEVAMHCVENKTTQVMNITRLEANAAYSLVEKKDWVDKELTGEEMEHAKSIVAKCGGLPKVIVSIGEVHKSDIPWLYPLSDNFMGKLETEQKFPGLRPLFSWMQSYSDVCSDSIKPCIFYLSIFDVEKNIRFRRLLWRWIAEGYCRDTSDGRTCEENGEKFITELVKLSIVQESASSKVFCQINGFFHEYIISRPMEDNLVFALEKSCSLNSARAGQHLTIRSSWDRRDRIVYESIDFSRLRSLTVFGKWEPFFVCSENISMRLLRVLDLEDATDVTNQDLEQIAKLLPRLKFLSLRGHTKITCLPSSIGGLRQLQTLDIRHTSIATLPIFITKLQKLRYIRAGTTEVWDWEGDVILIPAADGEEVRASSSATAQVTDLPAAAATIEATPTVGGTDSSGLVLPADAAGSSVSCNNRPRTLVSSLLSKLCRRGGGGFDNNGPAAGVTVPADIGKLEVLQTLGVVKDRASSEADGEEDRASSTADGEDRASSAADDEEDRASSSAQAAAATPAEGGTNSTGPVLPAQPSSSLSSKNRLRPRTLVSSLLSKLCRCGGGGVDNNNGPAAGVTVPADIGNLSALHTLGVVMASAQCSKDMAIFEELKKLRQLCKLSVSGINKGNIRQFCEAISGHAHLKSLSVEADEDYDLDGLDKEPPKRIKSLKLYGRVHKLLLVWIVNHPHNLEKVHLTIEKPEELQELAELLSNKPSIRHLRIRPLQEGELFIGRRWDSTKVVEIQCSSILYLNFDDEVVWRNLEVLKVHISGGGSQSSLHISGLSELRYIKEVWLKGYTDAQKQEMQEQINYTKHWEDAIERIVLKLVKPCSS